MFTTGSKLFLGGTVLSIVAAVAISTSYDGNAAWTAGIGLIAMFVRYRQEALAVAGGEWKPADIKIPEVPTNVNLLAFLFIGIFAQWGVYAAISES